MIIISFNAFWKILRLENLVRKFLGLSFGPGIFLGVLIFAPICLIIPLTLDPNYHPPPPTPRTPWKMTISRNRGVTIHIPCDSIRFRLLPFEFDYVNVS